LTKLLFSEILLQKSFSIGCRGASKMYQLVRKSKKNDFEYRRYFAKKDHSGTVQDNYLTVVFHGHTSDLDLWHNRCMQIRDAIPNNTVVAIQAPFVSKKEGYTWLDLSSPLYLAKTMVMQFFGVAPIVKQLNQFIDKKAEEYGVEKENVALIGHSMGGIMALQTAFNSRSLYGVVCGLSSALPPFTKVKNRPEVFVTMGSEDAVFIKKYVPELGKLNKVFNKFVGGFGLEYKSTISKLKKHKVNFIDRLYEGEGHDISDAMLKDGISYISEQLSNKKTINKCKTLPV